jgi:putative transposase
MNFETAYIYHIYNQGNNHRNIFYKTENYQFFLSKVETYVKPYADILAYCLMPNHFHLINKKIFRVPYSEKKLKQNV